MCKQMLRVSSARMLLLFVVVVADRLYMTAHQLDRSDEFFPREFVCSLSSRACAAARDIGTKERIAMGRSRGAPHLFFGIRRPGILDLR